MPDYTLRTHPDYTLVMPGHPDRVYRNGDPITISEEQARTIAYASKWHRFEPVEGGTTVGQDRHRTGRIPPADSDQAPPAPSTTTRATRAERAPTTDE